ncbi:MAG: HTTM domain-containing protein [Myxococcota bacterium]
MLPRSAPLADGTRAVFDLTSLHAVGGGSAFESVLFVVAAIAGVLLGLGCWTRTASVVSWVLVGSLQARNPMLNHGEDILLVCVLFFGMLLPWGARFSLDTRGSESPPGPDRFWSFATSGYALQIAAVYGFGALLKTGPEWFDGSAVRYAFASDMARPLGVRLADFPEFLRAATHAVLAFEYAVPVFLLAPIVWPWLRLGALIAIAGFHLGSALTLSLGGFPLVGIVSVLGLIPSGCWRATDTADVTEPQPIAVERSLGGRLRNAAALGATALVLVWNLASLPGASLELSPSIVRIGTSLRLGQSWWMFAPSPPRDRGWHVVPGTLEDGRVVDLFRDGAPVDWERPDDLAGLYPTFRWAEYLRRISAPEGAVHLELYAAYLCRAWNENHTGPERLRSLEIAYQRQRILFGPLEATPKRIVLRRHRCARPG